MSGSGGRWLSEGQHERETSLDGVLSQPPELQLSLHGITYLMQYLSCGRKLKEVAVKFHSVIDHFILFSNCNCNNEGRTP